MAVPQGFRPSLSPRQVKEFQRLYEQKPEQFNEQTKTALAQHAEYYRLPFADSNESFSSSVGNVMKQAGKGFWEGLTTLKAGAPPENDAEAIARNIGHLAGFVGFTPAIGTPLKLIGLKNAGNALNALKGTSVPMAVANRAQRFASKAVTPIYDKAIKNRVSATATAGKFLQSDIPKDIASGAFHLGVASTVSSWQGGVDEMMSSFLHGAGAGAFFRGLGNAVKTGNEAADKTLRTISASLFTGLPSTVAGETTPIQIYQYLLGAYFGFHESPISKRKGEVHLAKMRQQYNPETNQRGTSDPREVKGWYDLDKATQDYVVAKYKPELEDSAVSYAIAEKAYGEKAIKEREALAKAFEEKKVIATEQEIDITKGKKTPKEEAIPHENQLEDSDPQMIPERLTHNSKKFVDRFLMMESRSQDAKIKVAADLDAQWAKLIQKGIEKKENPSEEMISYVSEKYGGLNQEAKDFWHSYGFRKLRDRPVLRFTMQDGKLEEMLLESDWGTTDLAGNKKLLVHEPKEIEKVYNTAFKGERPGFSYGVLDHIIMKAPTGYRNIDIGKYKETLSRVLPKGTDVNKVISKEFSQIWRDANKRDMYYYGGKGDSENLFFVKYHPEVATNKNAIKKQMKDLERIILSQSTPKERAAFRRDRKDFIKETGEHIGEAKAAEIYDKSFISNILYEVGLNGFQGGMKDVNKVLTNKKFINDARGYNKRAQIWLTNGYSSDPKAVAEISGKLKKGKADIIDGNLNIKLVNDIGKEAKHVLGTKNSEYFESGDGPIYGRSDVITALNRQAGLPEEGGVNKSFILSPSPKYGALLGKYMIHPVSPKMEAYMLQKKIHLIIPKSSAKQTGFRELGNFEWYRKAPRVVKKINQGAKAEEAISYKLPIEHIKIITSETTSKKTMDNKRFPKQMWTNFTPYAFFDKNRSGISSEKRFNEELQKRFDDMYETLVQGEIKGELEYNTLVDKLIEDPVLYEKNIPKIINNLDRVGMDRLLEAIKTPGNEKFANEAYRAIHRMNKEIIEEIRVDGELTDKEVNNLKSEMFDYGTVNERIINLMDNSLAGFLHKFPRDYRMSVMRNYFLHRITRPTVGNSLSARIRPYEIGMFSDKEKGSFVKTERLQREDDIFFLGDKFKEKIVDPSYVGNYKKMKLGELWEASKSDPKLAEFFEAIVMRVPMDSISGAHKLKFAGFTGTNDMGILLHGRSMKSLGGADLDGDKTMVFFGGRNEKGEGVGFKNEWKDIYDWSKNEYIEKSSGGFLTEADSKEAFDPIIEPGDKVKKTYREKLTLSDKNKIDERVNNKFLQYSPRTRRDVSLASSEGRANLGTAVTQAANIRAAYTTIRSMEEPYTYIIRRKIGKNWKEFPVSVTVKTDLKNMQSFRGLTRASIGLSSDPMNEAGLKFGSYGNDLLIKQTDRLFNYDVKGKPLNANERRRALIGVMSKLNRGMYGKDYKRNRRFQIHEIMEQLRGVNSIDAKDRRSFLTKAATDVQALDWSDKIFFRIDKTKLDNLYEQHRQFAKELEPLKETLYRDSMKVPRSDFIDLVYDFQLYKPEMMRKQYSAKERVNWNLDILDNIYSKGERVYSRKTGYYKESPESRRIKLNEVLMKAEDFIIQDLSDMASFRVISEMSKNLSTRSIRKIANDVDILKRNSYLISRNLKKNVEPDGSFTKEELIEQQRLGEKIYGEAQSASLNQAKIDNLIKQYKSEYSPAESRLFDAMMLGTVWKGRMNEVKDFIKKHGEPTSEKAKAEQEARINDSRKTSLSKLGYASDAIPNSSVKRMLKEYQELFDSTTIKKDNTAKETLEKAENIVIEDPYVDKETQKYIDDYAPFKDLKKGELNKEQSKVVNEAKDHLDHYSNSIGKNLNSLVRDVVGKDMNTMSLSDWKMMNNFFKMSRDGTWWSTLLGKSNNEISKWYYMMFPKTVDYDVMRREIKLFKARKPFKTKTGIIRGNVGSPEGWMVRLQNTAHTLQREATTLFEEENRRWEEAISPYRDTIEDGLNLFHVAVVSREMGVPARIRNDIAEGRKPRGLYNSQSKTYIDKYNEILTKYDWVNLKNKVYEVTIGDKVQKLTADQIVRRMNDVITDTMGRMKDLISGSKEFDLEYAPLISGNAKYGDYKAVEKFVKKVEDSMLKGERLDFSKLGLDGIQMLNHSQIKSSAGRNEEIKKLIDEKWMPTPTRFYSTDVYWAHIGGSLSEATIRLNKLAEKIDADKSLTKAEKTAEMEKAIWSFKQLTNDYIPDMDLATKHEMVKEALDNIAMKKQTKAQVLNTLFKNPRVGHQLSRENHLPGYSIEPDVVPRYMKMVIDNLYKNAAQLKMRSDIQKFYKEFKAKTGDDILANNWSNFYTMYAQEALGYPQQIPETVLNNPGMKIKGTPFAWFNDTAVINKINKVREKLGLGKGKYKGLDIETAKELEKIDFATINKWSNLEAKYQLATLLAHPKSAVTNLYGGTVHTIISAGWDNFKNARNWEYLIKNVNQNWKGKEDIEKWVQGLGVVEDWILYEAGMNPQFKSRKWKAFFSEAIPIISKDPKVSDTTLRGLANKHGLADSVFNKAAYFMRAPERALRRDAFMAHYLQARQNFAGAIKRFDDPILIKMALEGVKSTQFLYSAPFRPAFARSAAGKVLTRFQLWAWNSVRFRGEIIREARLRGFKQGTPEFERFKRLALTDMFMYGLSNIFMYSIFENGLPQPWGWMQDFADWAFGNERERSRAFYGTWPTAIAPLQAITPPLGRPLVAGFKAMMDNDWAQLGGYAAWSMIPFGRMGYDVFGNPLKGGKGGLIENPYRFVEKISGIPYQQIPRQMQKYKDEPTLGPRFGKRKKDTGEDTEGK